NNTSYTASLTALNGFSGTVTWSVSGLPSGATGSFGPASLAGSGSSTLTVTTSASTPVGTSTLIVTGTSGNLSRSDTVTLVVNPVPLPQGWTDADIGAVGLPGSGSFNNGTFT